MGRGLSQQQRHILALARAFNAANRGGVPAVQDFTYHVQPGDVFPCQPDRIAVADVAWAVELPDYHDSFGLWVLHGFRSVSGAWWHADHWRTSTTCRKHRTSMARAVDGLLERGMLCHAMSPWFALIYMATDHVLAGYGAGKPAMMGTWELDPANMVLDREHPLRAFWYHGSGSWPAYWLTPAGHDVAATVVCEFDADGLVDAYHAARDVWRGGVGRHGWWDYATPEAAEAAAQRRAAMIGRLNNTPLRRWARGEGATTSNAG
jgi:hypothetical protein